jgi:hypothetical protein
MTVVEWLLDSDPAIRWQVMRDLTDEPDDVVAAERSRVASEGWGARLLDRQAPDGQWGESTYTRPGSTPPTARPLARCCCCGTWAWIRRARKPVAP